MYNNVRCIAIVLAGGSGKRMGLEISKQFLKLNGKPIIAYTLEKFSDVDEIDDIILVTKPEYIDYCKKEIIDKYGIKKVSDIVCGGRERQESVFKGLQAVKDENSIVLIHDGVRPFVSKSHIFETIKGAYESGGCILGVRANDTIKICDDNNLVASTLDRNRLWYIQTPQTFKYSLIYNAHCDADKSGFFATDDSMIAEKSGIPVKVIEGSYDNIKLTTIEDITIAKAIIDSQKEKGEIK